MKATLLMLGLVLLSSGCTRNDNEAQERRRRHLAAERERQVCERLRQITPRNITVENRNSPQPMSFKVSPNRGRFVARPTRARRGFIDRAFHGSVLYFAPALGTGSDEIEVEIVDTRGRCAPQFGLVSVQIMDVGATDVAGHAPAQISAVDPAAPITDLPRSQREEDRPVVRGGHEG